MFSRRMPARAAISSEREKKSATSLMMSMVGIGAIAVMHDHHRTTSLCHQLGHVRVALQAPDIVGDGCRVIKRPGNNDRLHAVDRHGNSERGDVGQNRPQALYLLVSRDRLRAIGPGGLGADVDDIGAFVDHALRLSSRIRRREEAPAVREGVRRDVQNPHHQRIRSGQALRPGPMIRRGDRGGGSGRNLDHAVALRGRGRGVKRVADVSRCPVNRVQAKMPGQYVILG